MNDEQMRIIEEKTKQVSRHLANALVSVSMIRARFMRGHQKEGKYEAHWKVLYLNTSEKLQACRALLDPR